ncbi:MAG: hypothetical protein RR359_02820 [Bacilli bacterium]
MNISNHAMERYLEKIKKVDKKDIKCLVSVNSEIYKSDINKMIDNSKMIYEGKFNDKHKKTKFYVSDDICLVVSIDNSNVITLYRIDYGFNRDINKIIQTELMEELLIKDDEYIEQQIKTDEQRSELIIQRDMIDLEIESLQKSLQALKDNRDGLTSYINSFGSEEEIKKQERDIVAKKICYSNIYRNAVEEYTK